MNVLFVCNGNVARSQEAEVFYNTSKVNSNDTATSGGVNVKLDKPIDPLVIEVMNEIGYDLSAAKRKFINEEMVRSADLIISFKPAEELPTFISGHVNITYWQVLDPQQQTIEFHREVRDAIQRGVANILK